MTLSSIQIHKLAPEHVKSVRMMIQELADFEKMPTGPKLTEEKLIEDLEKGHFFGFIALKGDEPAGMALCYLAYSTWEGVFLHMEDLYVRPQFRKHGLGRLLVVRVCQEAVEKGYKRVEWSVLDWNPARKFYEKLGATNMSSAEGWLSYRLAPEAIENVANSG
uniref:N-acetyltransferase domain-containing protein n=1 Tax=Panagrellus redivivus TaxID=6233 RepID=A0A7E4ZTS0_PANRE